MGMDGCLVVYTRANWDEFVAARMQGLSLFSKEARQMSRFIFAGATEAELDKQARVMVPPALSSTRASDVRSSSPGFVTT